MKSIQTKISLVIAVIMLTVTGAFLVTAILRTNRMLDNDSDKILLSSADYYANIIDDSFRSAEQSVGSIYNYALKRAETYTDFLVNEEERDKYTNDISELGKSIAENTRGAMAVYLRYNPDDYGPTSGFWYTIVLEDGSWQSSVPTDMSLYDKNDVEHVGWYYIPIAAGVPMWMDPYFNKNLGIEMISYIIPYYYGDYTVGIMGMDINMSVLRESVAKISVYESGKAFLMAKDGNLIYHENYSDGIDFDDLPDEEKTYFSNILKLPKDAINQCEALKGGNEKLVLKELRNGMILGLYAPTEEIAIPQRKLVSTLLVIGIVILILAIGLCLLWVRTIIKPLKRMTQVAEHYANGDFDETMRIDSNDEVGKLSKSLQTMSTSLKQQIEIANSANEAKSNFLANMSHEIRTPINAVLGMNEMILRESTDENIKNYAYDIHIAGQTLLSIINDILDMTKIESGKMEVIPVEYEVVDLVNDVVNMVSVKMNETNLTFTADIDRSIPTRLVGDDVRIRQVLYNLLTNAIKYTKEGSVTLTIKCEREANRAKLFFSVKDTGIGISKEDIGKLFEVFVRIDEKKNRNIEGTGLGLNIVALLLKLMDSELKVESEYGKGSDFYFTLYQPIVDPKPIGNYEERTGERTVEYDHSISYRIPDSKLMVVDDNSMNRKVFVKLLKGLSCSIDQFESGMECLKHINDKKYDIIFMDHMMPEMDGVETFKKIRSMEDSINRNTPVIILTANAVAGAREKYMEEGFDNFLSKPIDPDRLEKMALEYVPKYKLLPSDYDERIEEAIGESLYIEDESENINENAKAGEEEKTKQAENDDSSSETEKPPISSETLKEELGKLKEAMAIFDIDVADAIIARLNGYSYDEEGQRILSELSAAVRNMDVLSVDSLVDEWK
ncbi:MAG: response regulator [Lachnospiraceae bacterium]|nr:response regulator [Lachnospiraceae bacterium]